MARNYRLISADSHLEVSPERWSERVPPQYRERAPRRIRHSSGGDAVLVENRQAYIVGLALGGRPYKEHQPRGIRYEDSAGAGTPEQRLQEQDQDGVDAEVLFPGGIGPNIWRAIRDDQAYKAMVRAWNGFLGEEYCAVAPDRLIGMGAIPVTGVEDAISELEYCARLGLKGVVLSAFPAGKYYPTPEDDRFYAAVLDCNVALTVHVEFNAQERGPNFRYKRDPGELDFGGSNFLRLLLRDALHGQNAVQMMLAGVFDRFAKLRVYFAENQLGWIPLFLESIDDAYERNRHWGASLLGLDPLPRLPSEYMRENCVWGFNRDFFGVRMRHEIGVSHIMWGSDFPHAISDWPHSRRLLGEMFSDVPEDERNRMLVGNAVEFFHLDAG